jgi:hypothetical protein
LVLTARSMRNGRTTGWEAQYGIRLRWVDESEGGGKAVIGSSVVAFWMD